MYRLFPHLVHNPSLQSHSPKLPAQYTKVFGQISEVLYPQDTVSGSVFC